MWDVYRDGDAVWDLYRDGDALHYTCRGGDAAWGTHCDQNTAGGVCWSCCTPKASPVPLIQALKYECYLDSPLVRFLMKRAICDLKITHYFFW